MSILLSLMVFDHVFVLGSAGVGVETPGLGTWANPWQATQDAWGLSMGPFNSPRNPRCSFWPRSVLIHCSVGGWLALMFVESLPHIRPTGTMCFHHCDEVEAAFSY